MQDPSILILLKTAGKGKYSEEVRWRITVVIIIINVIVLLLFELFFQMTDNIIISYQMIIRTKQSSFYFSFLKPFKRLKPFFFCKLFFFTEKRNYLNLS